MSGVGYAVFMSIYLSFPQVIRGICFYPNILKPTGLISLILHTHAHLNETPFKAKVYITRLKGQCHGRKSKVICT